MVDDKNGKYQQNLNIFNVKKCQQRLNEYKRINNENHFLMKRVNNARSQLVNKQQCDQEWKRHLSSMKKICNYLEKIDRFVSNFDKN